MKLIVVGLFGVIAAWSAACPAPATGSETPGVATLMELDSRFCNEFQQRGVDGWMAYFAADAVLFSPEAPLVRSKAAVYEHYKKVFGNRKGFLTWKPVGGEISSANDLGFTWGTWESSATDKEGKTVIRTGKYLTNWKKQKDGSWKIVADVGNPDAPPKR